MRHGIRTISGIFGLALPAWVAVASPAVAVVASAMVHPYLFGTIEFRGVARGGWYGFADKVAETLDVLSRCAESAEPCPDRNVVALVAETAKLRGHDPYQVLGAVNRLANRRPYRSDLANFHKSEYWASPLEFLAKSGDCEDHAIFKYALLRYLGFPADALRVVLVKRKTDGLGHAVLAAYLGDTVYILDTANDLVRPQREVTTYTPVFSFNENTRWAHIASAPAVAGPAEPSRPAPGPNPRGTALGRSQPPALDANSLMRLYAAVFAPAGPDPAAYRVQLGAFRSLDNANALWQRLWRTQWDVLGEAQPEIHSVDLRGGGRLHLLQIGAMATAHKAESLCRRLSERGVDCFVVKPGGHAGPDGRA